MNKRGVLYGLTILVGTFLFVVASFFVSYGEVCASGVVFTVKIDTETYSSAKITGASGIDTNTILSIPATAEVEGTPYPVTEITGFADNTNIVGIDFSNATNLQTIIKNAFKNCTNISGELILPKSLTKINSEAFAETQLTCVVIDTNNAVQIASTAFPSTTRFVFTSQTKLNAFLSANAEFEGLSQRCDYEMSIVVKVGETQVDTGVDAIYGEALGEKYASIMTYLNNNYDGVIGLVSNSVAVNSETVFTGQEIECEMFSVETETFNINKTFGENITLEAKENGTYKWYLNGDLRDETAKSITLTSLNSGNYVIKCETYSDETLVREETFNLVISPFSSAITFSNSDLTYSGACQTYGFSTSLPTTVYNVKYYLYNSEQSNCAPTNEVKNVGTYKVVIDINPEFSDNYIITGDNFRVFNIQKKSVTIDWLIGSEAFYDDIIKNNIFDLGTYADLVWQRLDGGDDSVVSVGLWRIVAQLKSEYASNLEIVNPEKQVTIKPTPINIVWPTQSRYNYSRNKVCLQVQIRENVEGLSIIYSQDSVACATNVGNYTIKIEGLNNPNYEISSSSEKQFNWEIVRKTFFVNWINISFTYNGYEHVPYAWVEGEEDVQLVVSGEQINANEGGEPYIATATTSDEGYFLENATHSFYIMKAYDDFVLDKDRIEVVYTGDKVLPTVIYDGKQTVHFAIDDVETDGVKEAGEYMVSVFTPSTQNYRGVTKSCLIRIMPVVLKSEQKSIDLELTSSSGFNLNAVLNVSEVDGKNNIKLSNLQKKENLQVLKVFNVDVENLEQTETNYTIKIKLDKNLGGNIKVYEVTSSGLNECDILVDDGYLYVINACKGTFAILREKGSWFLEKGVWLFSITGGVVIIAIFVLMLLKKPLHEQLEKQILKVAEKVNENNEKEIDNSAEDDDFHDNE